MYQKSHVLRKTLDTFRDLVSINEHLQMHLIKYCIACIYTLLIYIQKQ